MRWRRRRTPKVLGEAAIDLLGDERQQRRTQPGQGVQHGVERVVRVALVGIVAAGGGPEAIARSPDVPVVERVEVQGDVGARAGEVVRVHASSDRVDELARLGQHVAIEELGRVGSVLGAISVDVRIEREEGVRVPDGVDDQPHGVADARAFTIDAEVAAAQDGRGHEEPTQRVGTDGLEHHLGVGVVAEPL